MTEWAINGFMQRGVLVVCVIAALGACNRTESDKAPEARFALVERSRVSMGSSVRLTAWTEDEPVAVAAFDLAFAEFDRLDSLMSVWRPGSDVVRLNEAAGVQPVIVSQDTFEVLRTSQQISEWTGGKFDVTFSALSDVWKFDHDQDNKIPARAQIDARLPLIDFRALELDASKHTGYLKKRGMRVHLGGIGKGYAVDRAAEILKSKGLRNFMIQSGGDMYVSGKRGDRPWRLGVQDPRGGPDTSFAAIDLEDEAVTTSGDYERFFIKDGQRYHHILDPDTGQPSRLCRSVTLVAKQAMAADALDTGIFLLGAEAGMALIEKLPEVEGVIVTSSNQVLISSGLRNRLELLKQPTDAP